MREAAGEGRPFQPLAWRMVTNLFRMTDAFHLLPGISLLERKLLSCPKTGHVLDGEQLIFRERPLDHHKKAPWHISRRHIPGAGVELEVPRCLQVGSARAEFQPTAHLPPHNQIHSHVSL